MVLAVPEEQGRDWLPAHAQVGCGAGRYEFMCKACGMGWPDAAKQCWVCPGKESVPFKAPSAAYEADGITYNLIILEGKPVWIQQREGGSSGATDPGSTPAPSDRKLVDGTLLGRALPKTDTADEITMADSVPLDLRVDIRMEVDDKAMKVPGAAVLEGSSCTTRRWTRP